MATTFDVDSVPAVRTPLPTAPLAETLRGGLGVDLILASHEAQVIEASRELHPLLQAVHVAFAQHRPLSLSPDHVWLTLAHGFSLHVDQHAEALRSRFVRHEGRKELVIDVMLEPETAEEWAGIVGEFGKRIEGHVGPGVHRLLTCSFSTTTTLERVASEVVMMSAFRRYFDYIIQCICGIPRITLEGSPEDWAEIQRRVDILAEYDLEWWARALRPVLDELAKTARGKVNRDFWQCIYKPEEAYGGELATGWIMRLFPYLQSSNGSLVPSPAVLEARTSLLRSSWITPGIGPSTVPNGLGHAPVAVGYTGGGARGVGLYGGLGGVRQLEDGTLRPEACWAVGRAPRMTALVDRVVHEQQARPRVEQEPSPRPPGLPAELIELYDRCDGAVLFGRWSISRLADLKMMVGSPERGFLGQVPGKIGGGGYRPAQDIPVLPVCTLEDDRRFFGLYQGDRFVIVLCDPGRAETPEQMVVVGDVPTFFEQIFDHRGALWFEGLSGPTLYAHLGRYHEYLRATLTPGPHEPPTDLDQREIELVVRRLLHPCVTAESREFWWKALVGATGTKQSYESVFGPHRSGLRKTPHDVLRALGVE